MAGAIDARLRAGRGGDDAIAAALGGAEIDEEARPFVGVDKLGELGAEARQVSTSELALEDRVLDGVAPVSHDYKGPAEACVVGVVVADDVGVACGGSRIGSSKHEIVKPPETLQTFDVLCGSLRPENREVSSSRQVCRGGG